MEVRESVQKQWQLHRKKDFCAVPLAATTSGFARRYQSHSDILAGLLMVYMAGELAVKAFSAIFS